MCPFCIGAAAWAAAGVISAGGLGAVAALVAGQRGSRPGNEAASSHAEDVSIERPTTH